MKKEKGSIAIFVLVALLFMVGFLILAFAGNVNKSKALQEQFDAVRQIYAYSGDDQGAYDKAYTDLRRKNKQLMTASIENDSVLEITKTFNENMSNYRIYGNVEERKPSILNIEEAKPWGIENLDTLVATTTTPAATVIIDVRNINYLSIYAEDNLWKTTNSQCVRVIGFNELPTLNSTGTRVKTLTKEDFSVNVSRYNYVTFTFMDKTPEELKNFIINVQSEVQLPYNPASIPGVGNFITEENDENYKKYKIPVKISGKNLINISAAQSWGLITVTEGARLSYNLDSSTVIIDTRGINDITVYAEDNLWKTTNSQCIRTIGFNELPTLNSTGTRLANLTKTSNTLNVSKYNYIAFVFTSKKVEDLKQSIIQVERGKKVTNAGIYREPTITNIYLDEPLKMIGDIADYIDFKNKKLIRKIGVNEQGNLYVLSTEEQKSIDLPVLSTNEDDTRMEILTTVYPSKIEIEYQGYTLD